MSNGIVRLLAFGAVAAVIAASVPGAQAEVITSKTTYSGGIGLSVYSNGSITFANGSNTSLGTSSASFTTTFSTANSYKPVNKGFETFCIDLGQYVTSSTIHANVTTSKVTGFADARGNARDIGAAGWILNSYQSMSLGQFGAILGVSSVTAAERTAALQIAVWKSAYDGGNTNFTSSAGGSKLWFAGAALDSNVVTLVTNMLTARGSQTSAAGFINYPPPGDPPYDQDMLFAVPEPSSLAIAGLGVLGFVAYGIRRRRGV